MRDGDGVRVLDLINKEDANGNDINEVLKLIQKQGNCNFVKTWSNLQNPETVVKIVRTKKAEKSCN